MNQAYENDFAKFYDQLFGKQTQDLDFYKYFIEQKNGSALEIGSGTGRLLLPLLQSGLNVEGVEPSTDMIQICNLKAKNLNIAPFVYQQELQNLNLNKKYKTIYMPLYVFQHISKREDAIDALKKTYEYLETNGQVLISIFLCDDYSNQGVWEIRTETIINDENITLSENMTFDKFEQVETKQIKYEMFKNNSLQNSYNSIIKFRTYSRFELVMLLEVTGFKNINIFGDYTLEPANSESQAFIFVAQK